MTQIKKGVSKIKRSRFRFLFAKQIWRVAALVLIIKAVILFYGLMSYQVLKNHPIQSLRRFFGIWHYWDAVHYLNIAQYGYRADNLEPWLINFFPVYPMMIRLCLMFWRGDALFSAFIVSGFSSILSGVLLYQLVRLDYRKDIADRAVWFYLIFPTSYFLHIGYPESLFMTLLFGCLLAARSERWMLAGVLSLVLVLTRPNGMTIIPALAAEAYCQYRKDNRMNRQWLWIGLAGLGIIIYLGMNLYFHGDPFKYFYFAETIWGKGFASPWHGIIEHMRGLSFSANDTPRMWMVQMMEVFFSLWSLIFAIICLRQCRLTYSMWMIANFLAFTCHKFILSVPRYTLVLFPAYIILAQMKPEGVTSKVWTFCSILMMACFISLFAKGHWAF